MSEGFVKGWMVVVVYVGGRWQLIVLHLVKKLQIIWVFYIIQILMRNSLFEKPSLIELAYKEKYRVSYMVDVIHIVIKHLRYCKY